MAVFMGFPWIFDEKRMENDETSTNMEAELR